MHILFATQDDDGVYSCSAKNTVGVNTINFTLNILRSPTLSRDFVNCSNISRMQLTVRYNEPILLKCPVDGNPVPEITWVEQDRNDVEHMIPNELSKSSQNSTLVRMH